MNEHASALSGALVDAIPRWVHDCVTTIAAAWETEGGSLPDDLPARTAAAAEGAQRDVADRLQALLAADIDHQATTPLEIVRHAVRFPTEVLREAGVPPVERTAFDEERFPDDDYGLTPASLADLDEEVGALGLAWGAAKAFEHKRRHAG